ncbi:FHL1 [Sanghuangporus vaninii]
MQAICASPAVDLMDHATAVTPLPDANAVSEDLPDKISAYYSLVFPSFTYYVQTISVSIGRRSVRPGIPSSSDQAQVDVDLGPLKSVSRLHARIEYEEDQERFVLVVLGRNGAYVDKIWSGSGSRVPLGARSQIQIATRVFDFVLPPPPAPEDSPSPSSPSSTTRHLSPSIDVTSLSPDSSVHSPLSKPVDLPSNEEGEGQPLETEKDESSAVSKPSNKKRKKPGDIRPPPPAVMPPRPQFTYAQLCYRAITALDGKATLQEICNWISESYEWYRLNEGSGWESSIRHNLSSNRAFKKMERCAGERGKGFFWSVDPRFEHTVKDQEGKTHASSEKQRAKNLKLLEPPLKRSVKGDSISPLPPPLLPTNQNFSSQSSSAIAPIPTTSSTSAVRQTMFIIESPHIKIEQETGNRMSDLASLSHPTTADSSRQELHSTAAVVPISSSTPGSSLSSLPSDVIPIMIGPISSNEPADAQQSKAASILGLSSPPIAFQNNTIVLNPTIFSSLTPVHLKELESLGAKKAIEILQTYIVRFLKEKRKAEAAKAKGKKKKDKSKKKDGVAKELSVATANGTSNSTDQADAASKMPEGDPTNVSSSTALLSPTTGMIQAVEPLRISSPPVASLLPPSINGEGDSNEEIDIMGDSDEPAPKKRKVEDELQI